MSYNSIQEDKPSHCQACGEGLIGEDPQPYRNQVLELPVIEPKVQEYRLHKLECAHCGSSTRAKLPTGVSRRCYGPRLAGWISADERRASSESSKSRRPIA